MVSLVVYYPRTEGGHFDAAYYVSHHLPLVREAWGPYGLDRIEAYVPADANADIIAFAICNYRDEEAVKACFGSPRTAEVMADIVKYTNIEPRRGSLNLT